MKSINVDPNVIEEIETSLNMLNYIDTFGMLDDVPVKITINHKELWLCSGVKLIKEILTTEILERNKFMLGQPNKYE